MRTSRVLASSGACLSLCLVLVACSDDSGDGSGSAGSAGSASTTASSSPASSAPPTTPVADPVAAVQGCLDGGDLSTEPEDGPRFGALAELQVDTTGNLDYVGVFVYQTPADAEAHLQDLVDAGSTGPEVVGTVVLSGANDAPPDATEAVGTIRACAAATLE